jgi:hypothetical protein
MCLEGQVDLRHFGHDRSVTDDQPRSSRRATSWPASLLPTMLLVGLLTGGVASASSSSDGTPVLDMTVTTSR